MNKPHSWVAKKRGCGCIVETLADTPELRAVAAQAAARWIRDGLTVHHLPDEEWKSQRVGCTHELKQLVLFSVAK